MATDATRDAIAELLSEVAMTGERWLKTIIRSDWRADLIKTMRATNLDVSTSKATDLRHRVQGALSKVKAHDDLPPFVVKPQGPANSDRWAPIIKMELRENKDADVCVGLNVIFVGKPQEKIISFGHRFDSPEGKNTTHNYYHIQPIKIFRSGHELPGSIQLQPDTFPTFPLSAEDSLDLVLHAVHAACGAEPIEQLSRRTKTPLLRERAEAMLRNLNN